MWETPGDVIGGIMSDLPGPDEPATPAEYWERAGLIAGQLLSLAEVYKDAALVELKQKDPVMHACVLGRIKETRDEASRPRPPEEG